MSIHSQTLRRRQTLKAVDFLKQGSALIILWSLHMSNTSLIVACVIFSKNARNFSNIGPYSQCQSVVTHLAVAFNCSLCALFPVQAVED